MSNYANLLGFESGQIDETLALRGQYLFGEHTLAAIADETSHPNIQLLRSVPEEGPFDVELIYEK